MRISNLNEIVNECEAKMEEILESKKCKTLYELDGLTDINSYTEQLEYRKYKFARNIVCELDESESFAKWFAKWFQKPSTRGNFCLGKDFGGIGNLNAFKFLVEKGIHIPNETIRMIENKLK